MFLYKNILFFIFFLKISIGNTAQITTGIVFENSPAIILHGTIARGDLEKIKTNAKKIAANNKPIILKLDSVGGDFFESLKIGEFIKQLNAQTIISGRLTRDEKVDFSRCYSACFIIHSAGAIRHYTTDNILFDPSGNNIIRSTPVLGLHRPYITPGSNQKLTVQESKLIYEKIENSARNFLQSVGISNSVIDLMFRTASDEILLISVESYQRDIGQQQPYYNEWLKAKCPGLTLDEMDDLSKIISNRILSGKSDFLPADISAGYANYLLNKHEITMSCRDKSILQHQRVELGL